MALLFMDGFDAGDLALKWNSSTGNTTSNTTTRFNAGRSAFFGGGSNYIIKYLPASSEIYVGFAAMLATINTVTIMNVYTDSGVSAQLNITIAAGYALSVRRGTTVLFTTPMATINAGWNYIELRAKIDSAAGAAELIVNGMSVGSFTGNTKNTGTSTNIDGIQFTNGASINWYIDDVYVCDATGPAPYNTFLGEVRMHTLTPNAAGSSTQFTPSAGANYATVDELPYSATDYVTSSTTGHRDTYSVSDLPTSPGTILAVQNNIIAKRTDATPVDLKPTIVSAGTPYYGANVSLTASDITYRDLLVSDPATGVSWTASGVNAAESGFEIV